MVESIVEEEEEEDEILLDYTDAEIIVNGVRIKVMDEDGVMDIDHSSTMDGYVAFSSENNNVSVNFME